MVCLSVRLISTASKSLFLIFFSDSLLRPSLDNAQLNSLAVGIEGIRTTIIEQRTPSIRGSELTQHYVLDKFGMVTYPFAHPIWFSRDTSQRFNAIMRTAIKLFVHTQVVVKFLGVGFVDELRYAQKLSFVLLRKLLRLFEVRLGNACKAVTYRAKSLNVHGRTDAGILRADSNVCVMTWEDNALGVPLTTANVGQAASQVTGISEKLRDDLAFIPPRGLSLYGVLTNGVCWIFVIRKLINGHMSTFCTPPIHTVFNGVIMGENIWAVTRMLANAMENTNAILEALDGHLAGLDDVDIPPPTPPHAGDGDDRDSDEDDDEAAHEGDSSDTTLPHSTYATATRSSTKSARNSQLGGDALTKMSGLGYLSERNLAIQ